MRGGKAREGTSREGVEEGGGGRHERRLLLGMGMSHNFELALGACADIVHVGTGIFGALPPRKGNPPADSLRRNRPA